MIRKFTLVLALTLIIPACTGLDGGATPTPTEYLPSPTPLPARITDAFGVPMVLVPAGEFLMGSEQADGSRFPIRTLTLGDFYIDVFEITNTHYAECVQTDACQPPRDTKSQILSKYYNDPQYGDYPVNWVTWHDAQTYCTWRGARLPTEIEWEKAARGVDGRLYPWGDEFDSSRANFCDRSCALNWANKKINDGFAEISPVGAYPDGASPYGVLDMAGNVFEWVADFYGKSPEPDPTSGEARVLRGGSWINDPDGLRVTTRLTYSPDYGNSNFGFRCALTP